MDSQDGARENSQEVAEIDGGSNTDEPANVDASDDSFKWAEDSSDVFDGEGYSPLVPPTQKGIRKLRTSL